MGASYFWDGKLSHSKLYPTLRMDVTSMWHHDTSLLALSDSTVPFCSRAHLFPSNFISHWSDFYLFHWGNVLLGGELQIDAKKVWILKILRAPSMWNLRVCLWLYTIRYGQLQWTRLHCTNSGMKIFSFSADFSFFSKQNLRSCLSFQPNLSYFIMVSCFFSAFFEHFQCFF